MRIESVYMANEEMRGWQVLIKLNFKDPDKVQSRLRGVIEGAQLQYKKDS